MFETFSFFNVNSPQHYFSCALHTLISCIFIFIAFYVIFSLEASSLTCVFKTMLFSFQLFGDFTFILVLLIYSLISW